jgi:3D (Asp-Asp-Asp) domain-containing protein
MAEVTQVAVDVGGLVPSTAIAAGSQEEDPSLAPEGEVIDASLNRRDTETGSTGDLFWLTTYTCEEGYCGFTASGVQVSVGMAAASVDWPFGSRFRIRGDPIHPDGVVVQDRGSAVTRVDHLDVFFESEEEAAAWLAQVGDHAEVRVVEAR